MKDEVRERTLTPAEAGDIYGKFKPSPLGIAMLRSADDKRVRVVGNRKERRHKQEEFDKERLLKYREERGLRKHGRPN